MKILWAPWRSAYVTGQEKNEKCIFCQKIHGDDKENLVLWRGKSCFAVLNIYPYNNGHLMIAPYRHTPSLNEMSEEEKLEIMQALTLLLDVLKEALNCDGFNIGMNIGKVAGAGVPDHIHLHIVPRWEGDTNFMPVIGDTKVIPQSLSSTYETLKRVLDKRR
ncbi:MAG: HIT family protein [bacterium]